MKNISRRQMSDAFITSVFLALSGGLQDAYTYMARGKVFANAQTGNIVLMAANFFEGQWRMAGRYFLPLLSFACGVYAAEHIRRHYHHSPRFHWRQFVVGIEIIILFAVGFLPQALNLAGNILVSFVCAMQVQAFRKVDGNAYSSTMCIGNLRSGTEHLYAWIHNGQEDSRRHVLEYFGVIVLFAAGAGAGSVLTLNFGVRAIWMSCFLLFISLCIMFIREDVPEIEERIREDQNRE